MELDKRIKDGKRPLTCLDIEQAREFVGKECIFSDKYENFKNLDKYLFVDNSDYSAILSIDERPKYEDYVFRNAKNGAHYSLILPLEWVKEPKKKYRPFSIEDWKFKHSVGDTILYRYKGTYCDDHREVEVMYLGYVKPLDGVTDEAGKGELVLGNESLVLQNLFNNYEIWVDGGWKPFGIEVEE